MPNNTVKNRKGKMKILNHIRWTKSPFTLGVLSGIGAIVLDFIWAIAEVLKMLSIVNVVFAVHIVLLIGFPICAFILAYSLVLYAKSGYAHKEKTDEIEFQLKQLKVKHGFMKSLEDEHHINHNPLIHKSPFINN